MLFSEKQWHFKLVATGKRRNQLASEPNYHTTKYFSESLIPIEIKQTGISRNMLVC